MAVASSITHRSQTSSEALMDDARFDEIARSLAAGSSRRGAIRIVGGLLGSVAGLSLRGSVRAVCPIDDPTCGSPCQDVDCGECGACVSTTGQCRARNEGVACTEFTPTECQQAVCSSGSCVLQNRSGSCTS